MIISLGGDGTYLKAVNLNPSVPVLGINMGSLGFLTPHEEKEALPLLKKTLQGKMFYRKDSFLKGDICKFSSGSSVNAKQVAQPPKSIKGVKLSSPQKSFYAVNDIVVERGSLSSIISLSIYINNQYIYSFKSDGVIIASPLGSTAYNLAAGGPILHAQTQSLVITPICSHSLTNRPIVISDKSLITLLIHAPKSFLTIDGQTRQSLSSQNVISITKNKNHFISIVKDIHREFPLLREKLKFGQRD